MDTPTRRAHAEPMSQPELPTAGETELAFAVTPSSSSLVQGQAHRREGRSSPLVSVVTRTTGRVELADALASVAAQTYQNVEVILVDVRGTSSIGWGAPDGRPSVRMVTKGKHLGRGAAANAGIDAARGDYVLFLDDDDWFLPDHIEMLVKALAASEDAKAAYAGIECRRQNAEGSWEVLRVFNEPYNATRLLLENYLPIHAVLFKRCLLGEHLRFDESLRVYEDWDFWIQLSQLTRFVHVDRVTAIYRISQTSGFGVREGDPESGPGYAVLLEKWRVRWTTQQLVAIAELPGQRAESATRELQKRLAADADTIARLRAQVSALTVAVDRHTGFRERILELESEAVRASVKTLQLCHADQQRRFFATRLNAIQSSLTWQFASRVFRVEQRFPRLAGGLAFVPKALWWLLSLQLSDRLRRRRQARVIQNSGMFSDDWYIAEYPEVLLSGYRPLAHWLNLGWRESKKPNPLFDSAWYLNQHPDLAASGANPLVHYLQQGAAAGWDPNPLFDTAAYVHACGGACTPSTALLHFAQTDLPVTQGVYRTVDTLRATQDAFRRKTQIELLYDQRQGNRRYAVFLQCGQGSEHHRWLPCHEREWDLIVNHYDATYTGQVPGEVELLQGGTVAGTKFTAIDALLHTRPDFFGRYEHVLLLDDDIELTAADINSLFAAATDNSFDLLQASLSPDSHVCHPVFRTKHCARPRYVNGVEIMMPLLSRRALNLGRDLFRQTISGWGFDFALAKLVSSKLGGRAAIIDSIVVRHGKPIDLVKGAYYRMLNDADIFPLLEFRHLQQLYETDSEFFEI